MTRFTTLALAVGFSVAAAGTAVAIETVPGMPPVVDPANLYSETMADKLSPAVAKALPRVYVPNLKSNDVTVIDPATLKVVDRFPVGVNPQHVVPSWDLTTLWVTNNAEHRTDGTLTPIDPVTGKPGPPVAVDDPYNMYFTPDGRSAIVVAEALKRLDFRDPKTMALQGSVAAPQCAGIPQDIRISPDGKVFYVAELRRGGVYVIDGDAFKETGFIKTGVGTHGLYPSRDGTLLYVANRGSSRIGGKPRGPGSVAVIDFATRRVVKTWPIPRGGSPDLGNVSADGKRLWLSGRYDDVVYVVDTTTGEVVTIPVGKEPHGLAVWPQPGRYSLGHTGNMR